MIAARRGYTLVELLAASASATVLVAGLASALYVAAQGLGADGGTTAMRGRSDRAATELLAEARHAICFTERSASAVAFKVADRTGDNQPETLRYQWGGTAGNPLTRSMNGATPLTVCPDVQRLEFVTDERLVVAEDVTIPKPVPWPIVQSSAFAARSSAGASVSVARPTGVATGELLLAAVAVNGNRKDSLVFPAGFSLLDANEEGGTVTLGVAWKVAGVSEPVNYAFSWGGDEFAVAWVLRISGQYPGNPVTTFTTANGSGTAATCAAAGSSIDHSLIVRVGAFDNDAITTGQPGLAGHTAVLMEASGSNKVSGGCGWEVQRRAGDCGQANFALTASEEYRTVTVVIAPAEAP